MILKPHRRQLDTRKKERGYDYQRDKEEFFQDWSFKRMVLKFQIYKSF
jgi:hypothetical protein